MMKKFVLAASLILATNFAMAQAANDCAARAMSKDGKPLAGAARSSFMKKCQADTKAAAHNMCAEKAVSKEGKPLAGAARSSFMKKCVAEAK